MKKTFLILLTVVVITIIIIVSVVNKQDTDKDKNSDFVFIDTDGNERHLRDYKGKVVILDLWATWCAPCQYQMLELLKIHRNYSRDDVEILSINIDPSEDLDVIKEFRDEYKKYGYELTWVFGDDHTGDIWRRYKVGSGGIPALCIFNRDGELVFAHEGLAVYSDPPAGFPADITRLAPTIDELVKQ